MRVVVVLTVSHDWTDSSKDEEYGGVELSKVGLEGGQTEGIIEAAEGYFRHFLEATIEDEWRDEDRRRLR